jgi:hypothetical protein
MRDYKGRYNTASLRPLNFMLLVILLTWVAMQFGEHYEIKAKMYSPASDAIVIREVVPGMIEYREREVARMPLNNEEIIRSIFGSEAETALKVAKCESGMNEKARNKTSTARGLFQIMASIHGVKEKWLYDPMINTMIAKSLYDASGWNPWESSRSCWDK